MARDERGFVGGSFVRIFIFVVIAGIAGVETTSILFARFQVQDVAEAAAAQAAGRLAETGSADSARAAADGRIAEKDPDARIVKFEILDGDRVRLEVVKRANTFLVHRFDFSKKLAVARGRAVGSPPLA